MTVYRGMINIPSLYDDDDVDDDDDDDDDDYGCEPNKIITLYIILVCLPSMFCWW